MSDLSEKSDMRLNLLLFSVCGIHFGVDAGEVAEIYDYDGEKNDDLFMFHEELGYGDEATAYMSPKVVSIRTGVQPYRVIIDSMEDIAEFSLDDIRLFPSMLEPFAIRKGLWGILPQDGRMVLLVDFKRLLKERASYKPIPDPHPEQINDNMSQ